MEAKQATPKRPSTSQYVLNRRAATVLGAAFLVLGGVIGTLVFVRLSPQRRMNYLRESAAEYLEQKQWPQASIQLKNILQVDPKNTEALYQLGLVELNRYEEAVQTDDDLSAHIRAANYLEAGISCLRRVADLDPNHRNAHRRLLELDLRTGNWSDASLRLTALQAMSHSNRLSILAREIQPSPHGREIERGLSFLREGDIQEAVQLLEPLSLQAPDDLNLVEALSLGYAHQGRDDSWIKLVQSAKRAIGRSARLDLIRAQCLWVGGAWEEAKHCAELAMRSSHVEVPARFLLADLLSQSAHANQDPTDYWDQAAGQYREILTLVPWDERAANNLAWILGEHLGQRQEALTVSGAALATIDNPSPTLLDTHGWLLLLQGEVARSILFLERAARSAPKDRTIQAHLHVAYQKAGHEVNPATQQSQQSANEKQSGKDERPLPARLMVKRHTRRPIPGEYWSSLRFYQRAEHSRNND